MNLRTQIWGRTRRFLRFAYIQQNGIWVLVWFSKDHKLPKQGDQMGAEFKWFVDYEEAREDIRREQERVAALGRERAE